MPTRSSSQKFSFEKKSIPLVVIGLPRAGKTSLVRRMKTGEFLETKPTLGMQFDTTEIDDARFDLFDLGGHVSYRQTIWETYTRLAYGIIFIVDSANPEEFDFTAYDCDKLFVEGSEEPYFTDMLFANRFMKQMDSLRHGAQQNKIYIFHTR